MILSYQILKTANVSTVPLTLSPGTEIPKSVYSLQLIDFLTNDYLHITANGQIENPYAKTVLTSAGIQITQNSVYSASDPTLVEIIPATGMNIDGTIHYDIFPMSIIWKSDADYSGYYLHYVWKFSSPTATEPTDNIIVPTANGFLSCMIFRF